MAIFPQLYICELKRFMVITSLEDVFILFDLVLCTCHISGVTLFKTPLVTISMEGEKTDNPSVLYSDNFTFPAVGNMNHLCFAVCSKPVRTSPSLKLWEEITIGFCYSLDDVWFPPI